MNQFSKRHFRDIDIRELIHHYRQCDCLWNFNSAYYKNQTYKHEAWTNIANYFNKDVNEVKRKVKYLRTAYVAEKKKVDASRKSGVDSPYKPSLFYYNDFAFLDNVVVWRKCASEQENNEYENVHIAPDAEHDDEFHVFENREDNDLKLPEVHCKVESFPEQSSSPSQMQVQTSPKIVSTASLATQPTKRKIRREIKISKPVKNKPPSAASKSQQENLYTSFGKTIALQLQQLPMETAILTMSEIHTILTMKTLEYIKSIKNGHNSQSNSESEDSFSEIIEETQNNTF